MAALVTASFLSLFFFMKRTIDNMALLFLGFIGLVYLEFFFLIFFNYGDLYLQYKPIRFIFPCIFLLLSSFYFKNFNKLLYYTIFFISSFSILWNVDSGIVVFLSWLTVLCFNEMYDFKWKTFARKSFQHLFVGFGVLAVTVLTYTFIMYLRSSAIPDYFAILKYQKIYYMSGFFMMHMPLFHAWNLIGLLYLVGLIMSAKSIVLSKQAYRSTMYFLSVLGLGLFSYYQGRSHDFNLFAVLYPAYILLIILADDLIAKVKFQLFNLYKNFFLLLILTFLSILCIHFLLKANLIIHLTKHRFSEIYKHKFPNYQLSENILFIKENTHPGEDVLILTDQYFDGIYYGETGTTNAANVPSFSELVLQKDYDKIIHFLKMNTNVKVFVIKNLVTRNAGCDHQVTDILFKQYKIVDHGNDMFLYLPIKSSDTLRNPPVVQGLARCSLSSTRKSIVGDLENFPENSIFCRS